MTRYELQQQIRRQAERGVDSLVAGLCGSNTNAAQVINEKKARIVEEVINALRPYYSIQRKRVKGSDD